MIVKVENRPNAAQRFINAGRRVMLDLTGFEAINLRDARARGYELKKFSHGRLKWDIITDTGFYNFGFGMLALAGVLSGNAGIFQLSVAIPLIIRGSRGLTREIDVYHEEQSKFVEI